MQKLKNSVWFFPLLTLMFTALFGYGTYALYYEFIDWKNLPLVFLNSLLGCIGFGYFTYQLAETMLKSKKSLLKRILSFVCGSVIYQAVFWGVTALINVDGNYNEKAVKAAESVLIALAFLINLVSLILHTKNTKKILSVIINTLVIIGLLLSGIKVVAGHLYDDEVRTLRFDKSVTFDTISADEISVTDSEKARCREWFDTYILLRNGDVPLPYTFSVNGVSINDNRENWDIEILETDEVGEFYEGGLTYYVSLTNKTAELEATVEATIYEENATIEWTVYIKNTAEENSGTITDFYAVNTSFETGNTELYCSMGSNTANNDFTLMSTDISLFEATFSANDGRPTQDFLPYFNLSGENYGLVLGIGWTGQWQAKMKQSDNSVNVKVKQENFEAYLLSNEEVRSPLVSISFYENSNALKGFNMFRNWIFDCVYPEEIPDTMTMLEVAGPFSTLTTEEIINQLNTYSDEIMENVDYYWMDAGWYQYTEDWADGVGSWVADTSRYTNGIIEISDYAKTKDCGLVLWYEPERVKPGTIFDTKGSENEEWLIKIDDTYMFNLANEDALIYYCETIAESLYENGISVYRQDFNFSPLEYWQKADAEFYDGRTGICENHYVTNLYKYLNYLTSSIDGLIIDNCASGGKRLDLEMTRRSIPLWRSDYNCAEHIDILEATQAHTFGLSFWLPVSGTLRYSGSEYAARTSIMPCFIATFGNVHDEYFGIYDEQRALMSGNYYPLENGSFDKTKILAMEYISDDALNGEALIYKRSDVSDSKYLLVLNGLYEDKTYTVYDIDYPDTIYSLTGKTLMTDGIELQLPEGEKAMVIMFSAE